jgi:hypothetical protein
MMSSVPERDGAGVRNDESTMGRHLFLHQDGDKRAKCQVRIMERFFAAVEADKETSEHYFELLTMYKDVLQDELAQFGYDLAILLFSSNPHVVRKRRAVLDRSSAEDLP